MSVKSVRQGRRALTCFRPSHPEAYSWATVVHTDQTQINMKCCAATAAACQLGGAESTALEAQLRLNCSLQDTGVLGVHTHADPLHVYVQMYLLDYTASEQPRATRDASRGRWQRHTCTPRDTLRADEPHESWEQRANHKDFWPTHTSMGHWAR